MQGPPGVVLRRASAADAALLVNIQEVACVAALPHIFPPAQYPFPRDVILQSWLAFTDDVCVAEVEGRAVGFCATAPPLLHSLYVLPQYWGKGIAELLLADGVARIAATGAKEARLWALEHNARARRFYEKHGWRLNGTTRVVEYPPHPMDVSYTLVLR